MIDTLCVILGGGRGTRLYPLTKERCKPAVPLAGKYRLIDIPISNCLNSGLNKIYVLTQFNSESLNKHIARTFKLDVFSKGFVEIMAAEQSIENAKWFQGTADAVRQCLKHFGDPAIKRILVLSGDQLYKFNFKDLLDFHLSKKSQITVACNPVFPEDVSSFGVIGVDQNGRIMKFVEKPNKAESVRDMMIQSDVEKFFLASMGIYLFEKDVLIDLLINSSKVDFGREVIPDAFQHKITYAFTYKGYWRDIGTMKSFYEENLMLTDSLPQINIFDEDWPFFTRTRNLPPTKITSSNIETSIIANGCIIEGAVIKHSVVGLRSRIGEQSRIEDAVLLGCDYYESLDEIAQNKAKNMPSIGVGAGCHIKKAIIDKNARIGNNVKLVNKKNITEKDDGSVLIRDGIIVVTKNALIKDNTVI